MSGRCDAEEIYNEDNEATIVGLSVVVMSSQLSGQLKANEEFFQRGVVMHF